MKAIVAAVTLSLISIPALADLWLCITDKAIIVQGTENETADAVIGYAGQKYLVDARGVKPFASDNPLINKCTITDNLITKIECVFKANVGKFTFRMNGSNIFSLISEDWTHQMYGMSVQVEVGKCSKIDD